MKGPDGKYTDTEWEKMSEADRNRAWKAAWWVRNRKRELAKRRDPKKRDRANKLRRDARARRRQETAGERFAADVARVVEAAPARPKRPRLVQIDAYGPKPFWVYPIGELAQRIGRAPATVRAWVAAGIIPGPTIAFGGKAFFSVGAMDAIGRARQRELLQDASGSRKLLRRLIREELEGAGESWVPHGRPETARVNPKERTDAQVPAGVSKRA